MKDTTENEFFDYYIKFNEFKLKTESQIELYEIEYLSKEIIYYLKLITNSRNNFDDDNVEIHNKLLKLNEFLIIIDEEFFIKTKTMKEVLDITRSCIRHY